MTDIVIFRIIIFILAVVIVVSRRPDALFNAQFYAEDGTVWYANAYNLGAINSLLLPYAGYLTLIQRLGAALSQIFPLVCAPLLFNIIAIFIQILPVLFITSSRFSALIPNIKARLFLAFVYLALPNSAEIHANLTNTQWHLAVLAYMVVAAAPGHSITWRCFDMAVILLSALSGPYCFLLTPLAGIRWWLRREQWTLFLLSGLCAGMVAQGKTMFLNNHPAHEAVQMPLGTALELLASIVAGQVFLSALIGKSGYAWLVSTHVWSAVLVIGVILTGFAMCFYALSKAPLELKLFIVFATLILGSALVTPLARGAELQPFWEAMKYPGLGQRYFFIPMLAVVTTLIWMVGRQSSRSFRVAATVALSCMVLGIMLDWHHPAFTDLNFKDYANKYVESPKGAKVTIPTHPPGWSMELIKH